MQVSISTYRLSFEKKELVLCIVFVLYVSYKI